jgi:CubicO group peptidase (beta-lactamase class C family)
MTHNPTFDLPLSYRGEVDPESVGMSSTGVAAIAQEFESQYEQGLHPGAQLVILRRGQVVLDRYIGYAHQNHRNPILPSTPFLVFSISKPFTAICVHQLVEKGQIDLDAPIAQYWPAFGCRGKETATVRHALLHQAGIPVRGLNSQVVLWPFWGAVTRNIAHLTAEFPPGSRSEYHLVNFGFILGEVVRRVSGLSVDKYLLQNFLQPMELDNTRLGLAPELRQRAAGISWGHIEQRKAAFVFNIPFFRQAVIPAATLHSTARDLAAFFQMLLNGGKYARQKYLAPETVQTATSLGFEGYDNTIKCNIRWGMGFALGGGWLSGDRSLSSMGKGSSEHTFGHAGQGTCIVWADPDEEIVLAFTCNRLYDSQGAGARQIGLANALWDSLEKLPENLEVLN